eukprot:CAMPEP_0170510046 /NCGR_PEP_ID=MMETSP0208-20121228/65550_1 /TAXON_ID=197538 /ORGANISM="Strombidium inclinatum, Strain S3" /LENGTH=54 /DNA_ID=CAMNT_0010793467 /DNA_START=317 /DNA_END=481 /DNA_ORIENTATION=-
MTNRAKITSKSMLPITLFSITSPKGTSGGDKDDKQGEDYLQINASNNPIQHYKS